MSAADSCTDRIVLVQEDGTQLTEADAAEEIIEACRIGGHDDYVRDILRVCPHLVNATDESGRTPLHMAAANGHMSVIEVLLETLNAATGASAAADDSQPSSSHRVNVNARTSSGSTPLHWAVVNGSPSAVTALLKAGANVSILNDAGESALECVRYITDPTVAATIENLLIAAAPEDPEGDVEDVIEDVGPEEDGEDTSDDAEAGMSPSAAPRAEPTTGSAAAASTAADDVSGGTSADQPSEGLSLDGAASREGGNDPSASSAV